EPAGGLGGPDPRDDRQRKQCALSPEPSNGSLDALPGHLYVVATPIGNLSDLTARARAILSSVDVVACEDTRTTGALLARLGISRELASYHDHNETEAAERL